MYSETMPNKREFLLNLILLNAEISIKFYQKVQK